MHSSGNVPLGATEFEDDFGDLTLGDVLIFHFRVLSTSHSYVCGKTLNIQLSRSSGIATLEVTKNGVIQLPCPIEPVVATE